MTGLGRLSPSSGFLFAVDLIGLGLSRILPFKLWGVSRPGAGAYGKDGHKEKFPLFR